MSPVWLVAIESSTDLLAPICGLLSLIILVFMSSVLVAGKRRRHQWGIAAEELMQVGGDGSGGQMLEASRAERASDFLENLMRRLYYLVAVVSALGMVLLPMLPIEQGTRLLVWLALTATTFLTAFILLMYWRDGEDEREVLLRRTMRAGEERAISRAGLKVRDDVTGLHTPDFWLHALELRDKRLLRRPRPVTCLMIGVKGLDDLRRDIGDEAADELLGRIGMEIVSNVRPDDIVCRCQDSRFAIALLGCPGKHGDWVGFRVTTNIRLLIHGYLPPTHRHRLHFEWETATLPGDAITPVQLLRVVGKSLDLKLSLPVRVPVGGGQAG